MLEYIYFVKCPNCEDEHFSFFNDAKDFAMSCLSKKPVITQIEVNRNDFGECVDSCDLGTVWSWEELMKTDDEPAKCIFTKDDLIRTTPTEDPEFAAIDNSLDFGTTDIEHLETSTIDEVPDNFRKPVPTGMTVEELVEAMEENEDEVECTWCEELYDKSECRKEVDLGWLCSRCQAAIMSRGEPLTFKENSYWDFLDESTKAVTWTCFFDGKEVGTVEAATEEEALEKMQQEYPEYHYGMYDGCFYVELTDIDLKESFLEQGSVELVYDDMTVSIVTRVIPATREDPEDYEEETVTDSFIFEVDPDEVATTIWENFITEDDVADVPGGLEALEDDGAWHAFLDTHFDVLVEKYRAQLLKYYKDDATEAAREQWQKDYNEQEPDEDLAYDEWRDRQLFDESKAAKPFLEELEEPDDYRTRLVDCPECGVTESFDHETGICINCGFMI